MTERKLYAALLIAGITPYLVNGYINSIIAGTPALYWSFELLTWIALPVLVFTIAFKRGQLRGNDLGLHARIFGRRNPVRLVLICALFSLFDLLLYRLLSVISPQLFPGKAFFSYQQVVPGQGFLRILVAFYFGLSAGIVEEMYFRGLMYKIAQSFPRPAVIYLVTSPPLFALIHWEGGPPNLFLTLVFGFTSCLAYLWFRNLWPLILGHFLVDFIWFGS